MECWEKFNGEKWKQVIDIDDFIINNYHEYTGSSEFLKGISHNTSKLWSKCKKIIEKEYYVDYCDIETSFFTGIDIYDSAYIDKKNETIVGLQTDELLKVSVNPFIALESSMEIIKNKGYRFDKDCLNIFKEYMNSCENVIENTYTREIKKYKEFNLFGNLPEQYSRGFISSDYRRLALYGADYIIRKKQIDLEKLKKDINYSVVRIREEIQKQIEALKKLVVMAKHYGYDIAKPASNAKEAVQWIYFALLASIKENDACSIPLGNISAFIDIYIERDIDKGIITEEKAQELIDQFIIKLRTIRFIRFDDYFENYVTNEVIFTETIGGVYNKKSLVTKTAYRFLNSLENIEEYSIPNYIVLWSKYLPINFKRYCSKVMLKYNLIGLVNNDKVSFSDICVTNGASINKIGRQIEYNGGSCNLPKILLYAINGGIDEITKEKVIDGLEPVSSDLLNYAEVVKKFTICLEKVITSHCDALNIIHYIIDKYAYENINMAFNDTVVERFMTINLVGLINLVDSLNAIKYGNVTVVRDESGFIIDYKNTSPFPCFGMNNEQSNKMCNDIIRLYYKLISQRNFYRNSKLKLSINSNFTNIKFGLNTGATPDGRCATTAYSIGCTPYDKNNVDVKTTLKSILAINDEYCTGGILTTININDSALGEKRSDRVENIIQIIDEYFKNGGIHLEFNVTSKDHLLNYLNSKKYNLCCLRHSGYSYNFCELNDVYKDEVLNYSIYRSI